MGKIGYHNWRRAFVGSFLTIRRAVSRCLAQQGRPLSLAEEAAVPVRGEVAAARAALGVQVDWAGRVEGQECQIGCHRPWLGRGLVPD